EDRRESQLAVLVDDGFRRLQAAPGQRRQRGDRILTQYPPGALDALHGAPVAVAFGAGTVGVVQPLRAVERSRQRKAVLGKEGELFVRQVVQRRRDDKPERPALRAVALDDPL